MQKYYAGTINPVNGQVIDSGSERGNETDDVLALRSCVGRSAFRGQAFDCSSEL
jgi:feruloyl esterase